MFSRTILAIAFATTSTMAVAQSNPPASNNSSTSTASPQPSNTATPQHSNSSTTTGMAGDKGLQMAKSATVAVRFVTVKPADLMTSRLIGTNVYNNQNETLGEIEDLVVDNGKTLSGVVVSVGGFLGIGDSYVVLDPSTIVMNQKDGNWRAYVDTSKDNLKNAPKFQYSKKQS
jgi:sporulation protein YlmC with PRC-barrel domain